MTSLYNPLSDFLKNKFGCRVFKVTVNAGFTCPNRDGTKGEGGCIYCDPSTLIPEGLSSVMTVKEQLERGIGRIRTRHGAEKFIAYFQVNTNTYAPADELERLYRQAISLPEVVGLAISTRPDCIDHKILGLLKGLKEEKHLWLELGLQTSKEKTLELIKRGHGVNDFVYAVEGANKRSIDVCAHVIIGLPGEDKKDALDTMRFISSLPVWGIKFHQLQVVKGTPLEGLYNKGELKLLTLEEYAEIVVECLEVLPAEMVIHRLAGDTPEEFLAAPKWGVNKFVAINTILGLLRSRNTRQGARWQRGW